MLNNNDLIKDTLIFGLKYIEEFKLNQKFIIAENLMSTLFEFVCEHKVIMSSCIIIVILLEIILSYAKLVDTGRQQKGCRYLMGSSESAFLVNLYQV